MKKQMASQKKLSKEVIVTKADKSTVKGVGFNLESYSSEKGRVRGLEFRQADDRRSEGQQEAEAYPVHEGLREVPSGVLRQFHG